MGKLRPGGFWELDCPAPGLQLLGLLTPCPLSIYVKLLLLGCCVCWRGAGAQRFPRCGTRTHSLAPSLAFYHGSTREQVSGEKKEKRTELINKPKKKKNPGFHFKVHNPCFWATRAFSSSSCTEQWRLNACSPQTLFQLSGAQNSGFDHCLFKNDTHLSFLFHTHPHPHTHTCLKEIPLLFKKVKMLSFFFLNFIFIF